MRKLVIAIGVFVTSLSCFAQQDIQFTHFMYDRLSFNPGFAGLSGGICGTLIYRNQWMGFPDAPTTGLLNVHAPIRKIKGGLGLTYYNDQLGQEDNNVIRLAYSYHVRNVGNGTLGIGASAGIINKQQGADWIPPDGVGSITTDDAINGTKVSVTAPDFSLGLYYKAPNLYLGLSAVHLSQAELEDLNFQTRMHYYVMAGYDHILNNADFTIRPSVLAKSDGVSTQIDVNLNLLYKRMLWAGVTYRLQDAIAPMVGYQTKLSSGSVIKFGASYDVTTSRVKDYSNGTVEVFFNYCHYIDMNPPVQKAKNPRFL